MEFVGEPRPSGACNLLGVPGFSSLDVDDDEGEIVIGIRPKCSPLPRRKSSVTDEDSEPEPPLSGSRRVSFADAKGLSLVQVKEFDTWDVPKLPAYDSPEGNGKDEEEYFISPLTFSLPLSSEELFVKVQEQKVVLETIELLPGTTILKGVIRVLNISFSKAVYVRTTLDTWSSHFDLLAEYIPGSSEGLMDCFSFKLTLVPPFGEQGARVDFCLRYETSLGTFWANNNNRNYVLFCHQRVKERKEKPQKENKKSCLKIVGQNFSTVENISAVEAPFQENHTTDVATPGGRADTMKTKQISDGQSGTSEENGQNLLTEGRRSSSRRSRRKAARMARVRDYFAQRNGANDSERDESPPEAKQAVAEKKTEKKCSDVQRFPERSSESEGSQFVSESLETCSKPLLDVLHDTSPARAFNSEPAKHESISLADSATLTGGESATVIPDNPLDPNDEPAPAERQNIITSVSEAEESSLKRGTSHDCSSSSAAEPADSVTSAASSESLVSQSSSFTFGTVVAPLYHQVFGRVGSESQSLGDRGNPVRAALNVGDLAQSYPHTGCTVSTDANDQGCVITTQESNQEPLDSTLNSPTNEEEEEEEANLSMSANDILDHEKTPAEIIRSDQRYTNTTVSADTVVHPQTLNILNTDLLKAQTPAEGLHLQGEAQEDNLTPDRTETAQTQLPEDTCAQVNLDETQEVITCLQTSFMCVSERVSDQQTSGSGANDFKCVEESNKYDDGGKTVTANVTSEEGELLEALHDLKPSCINNSATKVSENICVSCFDEKDVTTAQISQDETNNAEEGSKDETKHSAEIKVIDEVDESMTEAIMSNYHNHGDTFVELKDEDDAEKIEHREMEAVVSKQEGFYLADSAEVKNWETMVEEEEESIITDDEECEEISPEEIEVVEEQLEDAAVENGDAAEREKDKTEDEIIGEITKEKDADVLENTQMIREEEIWEFVAGKGREEVEEELENQSTRTEETVGEEKLAQETQVEERDEQEEAELAKAKHFAEIEEVSIERTNGQQGEEIKEEEEEEEEIIELNHDDDVELEETVKPTEENAEEDNPDHREDTVAAESESVTTEEEESEAGSFEERSEITQNKVEDGLSAPMNNVQDERVIDNKDNTGEGQNAHIPTEMHLYKEEDVQSDENITHDLSEALRDENESAAAEGGSGIFADEPESDQTSHDSASAESDSDDEVELYMHCLRAVHAGAQAHTDRSKDTGFSLGKRPSISRSKLLSTPMPSISESMDEEQHLSCLQDHHKDTEATDVQPTAAALPSGPEGTVRNASWWKETFTCSNISKTLLYATLLVVFLVVAYHYDFLACFGLYLISVVWLCCQGEKQPVKKE